MDFTTISLADLTAALSKTPVKEMGDEDLAAALTERKAGAAALFAIEDASVTIEQANVAEALMASIGEVEAEQADREKTAKEAGAKFAAAKAAFSAEAEVEETDEADEETDEADEDEETDEADEADEEAEEVEVEAAVEDDKKKKDDEVVTAATNTAKIRPSAAKAVGRKTARPVKAAVSPVTITAGADIPNVGLGTPLADLNAVAAAMQARASGFAPFNQRAAEAAHSASGGQPVLTKFGVASVHVPSKFNASKRDGDYDVMKAAVKNHTETLVASMNNALSGKSADAVLTAALAWCSPSEVVYNWLADYVVDGLITIPEISAPRGGLMLTEGPQLAQTVFAGDAVDDFGFGGTEAEMIAGYTKTCETIVCPEFEDHRLDFSGYCWKIPLLTESAYPELIADAMRLSDVFYAHKMNRRFISDIIALSTAVDATGLGGVFTDTLEALTQIAIKERRWWNVGENAVMEVKLPQEARDIFKFDMARRSGLSLDDIATDQKIAAHFANHKLAVEYISDFDQRYGAAPATPNWPDEIRAIIYPAGTFVKAIKDVINMSAVYDAASLEVNEYTGVFFEQGVKTIKRGYRSHVVSIPVCVSGTTGANAFACDVVESF